MIQERALKVVLVLVGLIFLAGVYPLTMVVSMGRRNTGSKVPCRRLNGQKFVRGVDPTETPS